MVFSTTGPIMKSFVFAALIAASTLATAGDYSLEAGKFDGVSRVTLGYKADPLYTNGRFTISPEYAVSRLSIDAASNDSLVNISVVPMFRYSFDGAFVEAGIGAALFNGTRFGDKTISTAFQFSDNIGFGYRFQNNVEVGYRFTHYSNAGIKRPNPGINSQQVYVRYTF